MKKLLLLASAAIISTGSFAQTGSELMQQGAAPAPSFSNSASSADFSNSGLAAKGTGLTDTLYYRTAAQAAGPFNNINFDYALPIDSGRLYGMNAGNYKGYAQLYRFGNIDLAAPADTTVHILGLLSRFWGTKSPSSSKSVVFSLWRRTTTKVAIPNRTKFYAYGLPQATTIAGGTKSVAFSAINLGGTPTLAYFASPITGVNYDVYAGYTVAYTWGSLGGDTIGLQNTTTAASNSASIEAGTLDTLVNVNNIIQNASGTWKSIVYDLGVTNGGDQVIYPIIKLNCPSCGTGGVGIKGFAQNNLTFFGNYPNPAVGNTNIKFALKARADVTVTVMDATGKMINTIKNAGMQIGEHLINVNTSALAAGTYLYLVETSNGEGVAAQFTVTK